MTLFNFGSFYSCSFLFLFTIISCYGQSDLISDYKVIINSYQLSDKDIDDIVQLYGVRPLSGSYWYDKRSGIFGEVGGPALGVMYPGHQLGQLKSSVSNGHSGVFVNGRQLQYSEALYMARLFGYAAPVPGLYWLEANGNMGMEGYQVALGNIYMAIARAGKTSVKGDNFWSKGLYSAGNYYTGAGGQPSVGYVSVPGYGPVSHGMN